MPRVPLDKVMNLRMSAEDVEKLNVLGEADELPNASVLRRLIREEFKRRYEDQQPMIRAAATKAKPKKR